MSGFPYPSGAAGNTDRVEFFDDFIGSTQTQGPLFGQPRVAAAGTPIHNYSFESGGKFVLETDAQSEQQLLTLDCEDNAWINLLGSPVVSFRARMNFAAGTGFANAGDKLVMGVGSDYNADPDSMAVGAWFMITGASDLSLKIETDDGNTNNDDQDSTLDLVDNTWYIFTIDFSDLSDVKFYLDGEPCAGTFDMSDISTSNNLVQPFFYLNRASGTAIESWSIDWLKVSCLREV